MTNSTNNSTDEQTEDPAPLKERPFRTRRPQLTKVDGVAQKSAKYEIISDTHVTLDHDKAADYVDLPILRGERGVDENHVQVLLDHMRNKTFNFSAVTLASAWLGRQRYKINGQHSSWAVGLMPEGFSCEVREVIYRVTSEAQLKMLYSTYDAGKARTASHLTKMLMCDKPYASDLPVALLGKLAAGFRIWFIESEAERRRMTPQATATTIDKNYSDLFFKVGAFAKQAVRENPALARSPIMACMFGTFNKSERASREFWQPVADGLHLDERTDARYRFRQMLTRIATQKQAGTKMTGQLILNEEEMFLVSQTAWNKWRKGEEVKSTIRGGKKRVAFK